MFEHYRPIPRHCTNPLSYVLVGLSFACAGYGLARYIHTNDGFTVKNGLIHYKHIQAPIQVIDDDIIVGTLSQRIQTILKEDPNTVEYTVRSLVQSQQER
jgi:hypothetical protein